MYLVGTDNQFQIGNDISNVSVIVCYHDIVDNKVVTQPLIQEYITENSGYETILSGSSESNTTRQITYVSIAFDTPASTIDVVVRMAFSGGTTIPLYITALSTGDSLEWSRDFGWELKTSETEINSYVLTEFTSSGTWTKPAGLKRVMVLCVGAGGGAGSGRQGAAGENRFGGGGGGGGGCSWRMIDADSLTSTITVTIGTGGTGGAAQASTSSNGNAGTAGGDTSFGGLVIAKGGNGGGGGSTAAGTAGTGGQSSAAVPLYSPFALSGGNGTAGNTTTNAAGGVGFLSTGAPGGGGGGGISSANASGTAANSGGGIYENGVVQAGPNSGASPNGVNDVCTALFINNSISTTYGIGTAGAGNNPATPNGGNGGRCAGGGGGSGTLNGTASGKGGDGGNGYCCVLEMY